MDSSSIEDGVISKSISPSNKGLSFRLGLRGGGSNEGKINIIYLFLLFIRSFIHLFISKVLTKILDNEQVKYGGI